MTPEELANIVRRAGMTRQQFADALGVNIRSIFNWLSGLRPISPPTAIAIRAVVAQMAANDDDLLATGGRTARRKGPYHSRPRPTRAGLAREGPPR